VGSANQSPAWIEKLLIGRDRSFAAPTFAPDGLYLAKIDYDSHWNLPQISHAFPLFWNHDK